MLGYLNNSLIKSFVLSSTLAAFGASAKDQIIDADLSSSAILAGESLSISVTYTTTDQELATGLGFRLHFDSSALSCDDAGITDLLTDSSIGMQLSDDTDDYDNDSSTDKYLNAAWASVNGAWPSIASLPATLYTLPCAALEGFAGTTIRFSRSSGASSFGFVGDSITVSKGVSSTDTDGDGTPDNVDADDDNDGVSDTLENETGRNPLGLDYMTSVGVKFSCAMETGAVVCWGDNAYGQTAVPSLSSPTQVAAGFEHACAIDDSGVVCWGRGEYGETTPPALSNPTQVSAGRDHTCALDDSGVVCWGRNSVIFEQSTVPALSNPSALSVGYDHSLCD